MEQTFNFTITKPTIGQTVDLTTLDQTISYKISSVTENNSLIDTAYITNDTETREIIIARSKWQILGYIKPHTLTFSSSNTHTSPTIPKKSSLFKVPPKPISKPPLKSITKTISRVTFKEESSEESNEDSLESSNDEKEISPPKKKPIKSPPSKHTTESSSDSSEEKVSPPKKVATKKTTPKKTTPKKTTLKKNNEIEIGSKILEHDGDMENEYEVTKVGRNGKELTIEKDGEDKLISLRKNGKWIEKGKVMSTSVFYTVG